MINKAPLEKDATAVKTPIGAAVVPLMDPPKTGVLTWLLMSVKF